MTTTQLFLIDETDARQLGLSYEGFGSSRSATHLLTLEQIENLFKQPDSLNDDIIARVKVQIAARVEIPREDATELYRIYLKVSWQYGTGARYGWRQWERLEALHPEVGDNLIYRTDLLKLLADFIEEAYAASEEVRAIIRDSELKFVRAWAAFARGEAEMPEHKLVSVDFLKNILRKFEQADEAATSFASMGDKETTELLRQLQQLVS